MSVYLRSICIVFVKIEIAVSYEFAFVVLLGVCSCLNNIQYMNKILFIFKLVRFQLSTKLRFYFWSNELGTINYWYYIFLKKCLNVLFYYIPVVKCNLHVYVPN